MIQRVRGVATQCTGPRLTDEHQLAGETADWPDLGFQPLLMRDKVDGLTATTRRGGASLPTSTPSHCMPMGSGTRHRPHFDGSG